MQPNCKSDSLEETSEIWIFASFQPNFRGIDWVQFYDKKYLFHTPKICAFKAPTPVNFCYLKMPSQVSFSDGTNYSLLYCLNRPQWHARKKSEYQTGFTNIFAKYHLGFSKELMKFLQTILSSSIIAFWNLFTF